MSRSQLGPNKRRSPLARKAASKGAKRRRGPSKSRQHLEPAEVRAFFKVMPQTSFWYSYFFIEYSYGCRISEPALILDTDVVTSTKPPKITIKRLKKGNEKAGYSEVDYDVTDMRVIECVKVAARWKEKRKVTENPFLFASARRRKTEDVGAERLSKLRNMGGWQAVSRFTANRAFGQVAKLAKIPANLCHSHVLRHTRAVILLASGRKPEEVQALCGHSSLKMTLRYQAAADDMRKRLGAEAIKDGFVEKGVERVVERVAERLVERAAERAAERGERGERGERERGDA